MRFYLSFYDFSGEFKKQTPLKKIQESFYKDISTSGFEYYDGSIFTDYPTIIHEIEKSDILVALIDDYWTSSTWKAIELDYARGASPENEGKFIPAPLKCYLYNHDVESRSFLNYCLKNDNITEFDGTFANLLSKI